MTDYYDKVQETAAWLKERHGPPPDVAIVLGSGLGEFTKALADAVACAYGDVPHWPASAVVGHAGQLVVGTIRGKRAAALSGRVHYYEGHDMRTVTFGIRALAVYGVRTVILTNAAGGINLSFKPGTLMLTDDHINMLGSNPLIGPNDGSGTFTIPQKPIRRRLPGLPSFTVNRGGEYFFIPGKRALHWLAELET